MSKALKLGLVALLLLVVALGGITALALMQKQQLDVQVQDLQNKLAESESRAAQLANQHQQAKAEIENLSQKFQEANSERSQLESGLEEAKQRAEELLSQVQQAQQERDDWKNRVDTVRRERDELMNKVKSQAQQIVEAKAQPAVSSQDVLANAPSPNSAEGEDYWAGILKQKAALELELDKLNADLDQSAVQIVDLKKQNSDLQFEIKQLQDTKDEMERKIKYGEDLANNLSIELARARNDQKAGNQRAEKLKEDNTALQSRIKELTTAKVALEKNIAGLNSEKLKMSQKLAQTEDVIQGRINEIWQIKEKLDEKMSSIPGNPPPSANKTEVELPPIVVNVSPSDESKKAPQSKQGSILSINESNNFVIVDMGSDNSAVKVGHILSVNREGRNIATLEVIQVRRDICAADIKNKKVELKVGDKVTTVAK